ncbi:MAG TPA: hypothetical protein VMJ52_18600, partial [Xanthobacteraceae bacterium]|nr:hypothetical protein [Xanthobacteraceae bacterium]
ELGGRNRAQKFALNITHRADERTKCTIGGRPFKNEDIKNVARAVLLWLKSAAVNPEAARR